MYFKKSPTFKEWCDKIHRISSLLRVTYQEDCPSAHGLAYGNVSYTVTTKKFEGSIYGPRRGNKKQMTVRSTVGIFNNLKIQKEVTKRAPSWKFDSAFDSTLNPYLHENI
jgi:peptidoglycan hydrolase-like protein with peptidoglycan-binding domain